MPTPLLFPLNRVSHTDVAALQAALRPAKLLQPTFMQQRLAAYQGLLAPKIPVNLPWNAVGLPSLVDLPVVFPLAAHQFLPVQSTQFRISGTTRDSAGAALGSCVVDWFNTANDVLIDRVTSDANGLFEFRTAGQPPNAYYLVAYKPGSPDRAGTTVNTLVGV